MHDRSTTSPEAIAGSTPPNRPTLTRARANRPGLVEQYERDVLPALQGNLAGAFPEFGWRRDAGGWQAGNDEFTHQNLGVRADRVVSHGDAPRGFLVHGQGPVLWTTYVNGGTPARGWDFVEAVQAIAQRAGIEIDVDRGTYRQGQRERLIADTFAIARDEFQSDAGKRAKSADSRTRRLPPSPSESCPLPGV